MSIRCCFLPFCVLYLLADKDRDFLTPYLEGVRVDSAIDRYVATLREPASQRAARADLATFARWWEQQRDRANQYFPLLFQLSLGFV